MKFRLATVLSEYLHGLTGWQGNSVHSAVYTSHIVAITSICVIQYQWPHPFFKNVSNASNDGLEK